MYILRVTCASGVKISVALQVNERPSTNVRFSSLPATLRRRAENRNICPPVAPSPGESRDSLEDPEHVDLGVSTAVWSWLVDSRANELANFIVSSISRSSAADNCRIPQLLLLLAAVKDSFDGIIYRQYQRQIMQYIRSLLRIKQRIQRLDVGGVVQWQGCRSWSANFPCHTLDLQLMGDHLCG